jgi:starch phosphorylase
LSLGVALFPAGGSLPPRLAPLRDLALDLLWTWCHRADALWERIDIGVWERTRKPWIILVDVAVRRFPVSRRMPTFSPILDQCVADWHAHPNRPSQSDATYGASALRGLAYFSMEFGLGDALPLCAGGLGLLAGDLMKITSDLGVYVAPVDGTARCQPAHLESLYPRWPEHDGRDRPHHQRAARA